MLKRRSRSVGGKEGFTMSDSNSPQSPSASNNLSKLTASSHLLFRSFSSKRFADIEAAVSPTSILETRPFSSFSSIISNSDRQTKKPPFDAVEPIGLGIVDALDGEKTRKNSERSMVIFGSQLRVQIPSDGGSVELLTSPIEFGVKNKESQLASCHACKRILGEGIDIYMYRGEKAFCSIF